MTKKEMISHEHFEELCAVATVGDLSADERDELEQHLQHCDDCRNFARDIDAVSAILTVAKGPGNTGVLPDGMTERFLARARSEGIPIENDIRKESGGKSELVLTGFRKRVMPWTVAAAIILIVTSIFLFARYSFQHRIPKYQESGPQQHELAAENERLKSQLREVQERERSLSSRLQQAEKVREAAENREVGLSRRLDESENLNKALRTEASAHNATISQLTSDLERLRAQERADNTASLLSEAELKSLRVKIEKLTTQLSQAQALDSTLTEARELIVDKNVHLLNVYPEVDGNGRRQGPRGKIFYAEGKKLVFYAYDLTDPNRISSKTSFYVWGEGPRTAQRAIGLGKFEVDSQRDGRWVLRVTDSNLLAQITSVFVTVEPDKSPITQPTGKRMLSRVLNTRTTN